MRESSRLARRYTGFVNFVSKLHRHPTPNCHVIRFLDTWQCTFAESSCSERAVASVAMKEAPTLLLKALGWLTWLVFMLIASHMAYDIRLYALRVCKLQLHAPVKFFTLRA